MENLCQQIYCVKKLLTLVKHPRNKQNKNSMWHFQLTTYLPYVPNWDLPPARIAHSETLIKLKAYYTIKNELQKTDVEEHMW